jgi:hypothetical protein
MQTIAHVESATRAMDHRMDIDESQEITISIHHKVAELTHESRLRRMMCRTAVRPPKAVEKTAIAAKRFLELLSQNTVSRNWASFWMEWSSGG